MKTKPPVTPAELAALALTIEKHRGPHPLGTKAYFLPAYELASEASEFLSTTLDSIQTERRAEQELLAKLSPTKSKEYTFSELARAGLMKPHWNSESAIRAGIKRLKRSGLLPSLAVTKESENVFRKIKRISLSRMASRRITLKKPRKRLLGLLESWSQPKRFIIGNDGSVFDNLLWRPALLADIILHLEKRIAIARRLNNSTGVKKKPRVIASDVDEFKRLLLL